MSVEGHRFYPGETATPAQILQLADEYRIAAQALLTTGRRGVPQSTAPGRLLALQAIELYLNALLRDAGHEPCVIRRLQHDFAGRAQLAAGLKLVLRKRTAAHLAGLSRAREYLVTRYDPDQLPPSPLNRLAATLAEVGDKVHAIVARNVVDRAAGREGTVTIPLPLII